MGRKGGEEEWNEEDEEGIGRREFMKPSERLLDKQGHLSMAKKKRIIG